jgi:hypothetical protein
VEPICREEIYRLVRDLRAARLPRNRHFEVHATDEARAARRIHRFLRAVERDLRRSSEVRVSRRPDGSVRLELGIPALQARRTIELSANAHAVLLEDTETASVLARAEPETGPATGTT